MNSEFATTPFDFFERIFCINLPKCVERWNAISSEFRKIRILDRVERIWASPPPKGFSMSNYAYPPGEFGVCLSQMKALVQGLASGARSILIFEDDIVFSSEAEVRLRNSIVQLPSTWEVFYLGGRPKAPVERVSEHLVKVSTFRSAMSYAINGKAVGRCLEHFLDRLAEPFPNACADNILSEFALENGYCAYPRICTTVPGFSVLRGARRDYTAGIEEDWKRYGPQSEKKSGDENSRKRRVNL